MDELVSLIKALPSDKQDIIADFVKKIYLEWDPDFTKVTVDEKAILDEADFEYDNGEVYSEDDVEWKF